MDELFENEKDEELFCDIEVDVEVDVEVEVEKVMGVLQLLLLDDEK